MIKSLIVNQYEYVKVFGVLDRYIKMLDKYSVQGTNPFPFIALEGSTISSTDYYHFETQDEWLDIFLILIDAYHWYNFHIIIKGNDGFNAEIRIGLPYEWDSQQSITNSRQFY